MIFHIQSFILQLYAYVYEQGMLHFYKFMISNFLIQFPVLEEDILLCRRKKITIICWGFLPFVHPEYFIYSYCCNIQNISLLQLPHHLMKHFCSGTIDVDFETTLWELLF